MDLPAVGAVAASTNAPSSWGTGPFGSHQILLATSNFAPQSFAVWFISYGSPRRCIPSDGIGPLWGVVLRSTRSPIGAYAVVGCRARGVATGVNAE